MACKRYWNTEDEFGCITKFFHWSITVLVFFQFILIQIKQSFFQDEEHKVIGGFLIGEIHKPIGVIVLALGVLGFIWHSINKRPSLPAAMPAWQIILARFTHTFLYVAIIIMPLSGIVMSAAADHPVNFFHLGNITFGLDKDLPLAKNVFLVHSYTGNVLLILIAVHILGALKHQYLDRDNVLKRMWF